jgi:hypothetical protein
MKYIFSFVIYSIILISGHSYAQSGTLNLTIVEEITNQIVPARVEIRDAQGLFYIAEDALLVGGDCDMSDQGAGLIDLETTLKAFSNSIENPYTNSTQFYSVGKSLVNLPAGEAYIRIFKGPEYYVFRDTLRIASDKATSLTASLSRWINMPGKNWYSSDDHLHIPRPVKELDPYISKMMQAEDIHVANLLQMGKHANTEIALQHAHGPGGLYQQGNYILAAGQENPRTHFLGHTITLGAREFINNTGKYLIYRLVWEEAAKQGAINGFAHGNAPDDIFFSAHSGLAVILPYDLTDFMEVLQFNRSDYGLWYDVLNLGFHVTPTAGTDYPCAGQNLPGHERFYTKLEGDLSYEKWIEGVRMGRTFVTTGPILELSLNGKEIGSHLEIKQSDSVLVKGHVRFDPNKETVKFIEVVQNGDVIKRISIVDNRSVLNFEFTTRVEHTSWFALRGSGDKRLENVFINPAHFSLFNAQSSFHSAPIYIDIPGTRNAKKILIARSWLARLKDMENILAENNIDDFAKKLSVPPLDDVSKEAYLSSRTELLKEIADSKKFFQDLLKDR